MTTRRGKYWVSDPARLEKANAKREQRKLRNMQLLWSKFFAYERAKRPKVCDDC